MPQITQPPFPQVTAANAAAVLGGLGETGRAFGDVCCAEQADPHISLIVTSKRPSPLGHRRQFSSQSSISAAAISRPSTTAAYLLPISALNAVRSTRSM